MRVNPAESTEDTLVYQTEAHKILAQGGSGNTCTFYLSVWRCTFTLQDGQYEMTSGDRIPTALTFTWTGGYWSLTEYWTPGDRGGLRSGPAGQIPGRGGGAGAEHRQPHGHLPGAAGPVLGKRGPLLRRDHRLCAPAAVLPLRRRSSPDGTPAVPRTP